MRMFRLILVALIMIIGLGSTASAFGQPGRYHHHYRHHHYPRHRHHYR